MALNLRTPSDSYLVYLMFTLLYILLSMGKINPNPLQVYGRSSPPRQEMDTQHPIRPGGTLQTLYSQQKMLVTSVSLILSDGANVLTQDPPTRHC